MAEVAELFVCKDKGTVAVRRSPTFQDKERTAIQRTVDHASKNVEAFRAEANEVYAIHGCQDRATLVAVETRQVTAHDVLEVWEKKVLPQRRILMGERSGSSLRKLFARHMLLTEDEAENKVDELINERLDEVLHQALLSIYTIPFGKRRDIYRAQRNHARNLLLCPDDQLERLKKRYTNYMIYQEVAARLHIAVIDPYASRFTRIQGAAHVRLERKEMARAESRRLREIQLRLEELGAWQDGLLGQMAEKDWDIVTVMGLRQQYEKCVQELLYEGTPSLVKRLEIFQEVTREFRDEHTSRLAMLSAQDSLSSARAIAEAINVLLLQFFDLSATHRNQLLLRMREYRELVQERQGILRTQELRNK
jgi:hypothetical protein